MIWSAAGTIEPNWFKCTRTLFAKTGRVTWRWVWDYIKGAFVPCMSFHKKVNFLSRDSPWSW